MCAIVVDPPFSDFQGVKGPGAQQILKLGSPLSEAVRDAVALCYCFGLIHGHVHFIREVLVIESFNYSGVARTGSMREQGHNIIKMCATEVGVSCNAFISAAC